MNGPKRGGKVAGSSLPALLSASAAYRDPIFAVRLGYAASQV
jgi:hypothetical protein